MARPRLLIGKVATRPNLRKSWEEISRGKNSFSHGHSDQTLQEFHSNLNNNIELIRTQLLDGTFEFGKLRAVTAMKKTGKKRPLKIADVRDRVAQRAIVRQIEKDFLKKFNLLNPASHAYLPKRGVQSAIKQMLKYHQNGYGVVFEADIVSFFDNVNIDKLLRNMVFPNLKDGSIQGLIKNAFSMEIGNKDDLPEEDWELFPDSSTGLPQGGYLSPLFSNVYLSVFDRQMQEADFKLIRYADDFIVMCKTIAEAESAYEYSCQILEGELDLKLHERNDHDKESRTRIVKPTQIPIQFLGVNFNGVRIWPAKEKQKKLSNKLDSLVQDDNNRPKTVLKLLSSTRNLIQGWVASYGFTDLKPHIPKLDDKINRVLWKGLKKMGWKLEGNRLSTEQRAKSGVLHVYNYLYQIRASLSLRDKNLLKKYWTEE